MRPAVALVTVLAVMGAVAGCTPPAPNGPGLPGTIVTSDDTGLGDSSIDSGWIVAVPTDRADELWALASTLPEGFTDIGHLGVAVDEAALLALGAARAPITTSGQFRLDAPAGPAVVCWTDPTTADGLVHFWGCMEIALPTSGALRATWSEGGFGVSVASS